MDKGHAPALREGDRQMTNNAPIPGGHRLRLREHHRRDANARVTGDGGRRHGKGSPRRRHGSAGSRMRNRKGFQNELREIQKPPLVLLNSISFYDTEVNLARPFRRAQTRPTREPFVLCDPRP